jgi:FemAB-related protein (PEP-CTERM system-associated)
MDMKVTELDGEADLWEAYIRSSRWASVYHTLAWREVIKSAFGHRTWYLIVWNAAEICGVLPLVEIRSALVGHFLVSLPFFNYGGVLAESPEAERQLTRAALELAIRQGASHIELRQAFPFSEPIEGWTLRQHKAALTIPLAGDPKPHWEGISSRLRGKVRKAQKHGAIFTVRGKEDLATFYFLYALNMRDLGTPVYAYAFFENILRRCGQSAQILLARRAGRPGAAAIAVRKGDRIELPWICQDYSESSYNMNEFLYWNCIEWACGEGASLLDLGRSTIGAGTYQFKMQWKPTVQPLYWYYWTMPGVPLPDLSPDNPKYQLAVRLWKKLPLVVANRLGPWIVRNIP